MGAGWTRQRAGGFGAFRAARASPRAPPCALRRNALAQRLHAEARKGLRPLRQYVQRTKYIHQIDLVTLLMTREQARTLVAGEAGAKLTLIDRG